MKALAAAVAVLAVYPGHAAAATCPAADFQPKAQALIEDFTAQRAFNGSLLLAIDGAPVLRQGVGAANLEWNALNTPATKFRLGSITKQFTAAAILQLAQQGKLSIGDPISKYYTDAPPSWSKVTLKHLLTHTSGIPPYTGLAGFERISRQPQTPADLVKLVQDRPLDFEPGERFEYDNTGYVLLGYVIEKVSGQSYADYLRSHIFEPLGMADTGYDDGAAVLAGRAAGYAPRDGGWINAPFVDMSTPFAAGALYSTIDDLLIWDRALDTDKLLTAASRQAMFANYGHGYGFGWRVDRAWDQPRLGHGGAINGFSTAIQRYPDAHLTVVALGNIQTAQSVRLAESLAALCLGKPPYPEQVSVSADLLDRYAGVYRVTPAAFFYVERDGDRLRTRVTGQDAVSFYASGQHSFFSKTVAAALDFQAAGGAPASAVILHQGGRDQTFPRVDASLARAGEAAVTRKNPAAAPGSEAALRRVLAELRAGKPDYARMGEGLARTTRDQAPRIQAMLEGLGDLQVLEFTGVGPAGADIYQAVFANGKLEARLILDTGGKLETLFLRPSL